MKITLEKEISATVQGLCASKAAGAKHSSWNRVQLQRSLGP